MPPARASPAFLKSDSCIRTGGSAKDASSLRIQVRSPGSGAFFPVPPRAPLPASSGAVVCPSSGFPASASPGDSSRLVSHQEDTVPCGELVVAQLPCADPPARSLARSPWNTAQTGDHLL